ncbi:hypothetical protein V6Z12_A03G130700 [Gossypium hirsutum]
MALITQTQTLASFLLHQQTLDPFLASTSIHHHDGGQQFQGLEKSILNLEVPSRLRFQRSKKEPTAYSQGVSVQEHKEGRVRRKPCLGSFMESPILAGYW